MAFAAPQASVNSLRTAPMPAFGSRNRSLSPLNLARFFSLLFAALTFGPSAAHLLELPNKIGLSRDEYLIVQQIYGGWALLGIVIAGALIATLALVILSRHRRREFTLSLGAFSCLVAAQIVFWVFTYPTNQATRNWTELPQQWESLRLQWEYSHAGGAALNLTAFVLLVLAVLTALRASRSQPPGSAQP
jgi:hypothetical protein